MSETDRIRDLASGPNMSLPPKRNFCRQRANHVRMLQHRTLTLPHTDTQHAADKHDSTAANASQAIHCSCLETVSAENSRPHIQTTETSRSTKRYSKKEAVFPKKEPDRLNPDSPAHEAIRGAEEREGRIFTLFPFQASYTRCGGRAMGGRMVRLRSARPHPGRRPPKPRRLSTTESTRARGNGDLKKEKRKNR